MKGHIFWLCASFCAFFFLLPFFSAYFFSIPQGDDFDNSTRAMFIFDLPGALYETGREWLTWSGRYLYHFLAVFLGKAGMNYPGLICFGVALVYAFSAWLLPIFTNWAKRLFFALIALLSVYLVYNQLPYFYLMTDALTSGLQGALYLLFFACCLRLRLRLAYKQPPQKAYIACVITSLAAIGVYEHSALAIFWTAALFLWVASFSHSNPQNTGCHFWKKFFRPRAKPFLKLFFWVCAGLLFSFLAPGNQVRNAVRQTASTPLLERLSQTPGDCFSIFSAFFSGPGPLLAFCLGLLAMNQHKKNHPTDMRMAFTAITGALAFVLSAGILQSLSDAPLGSSPKFAANLNIYLLLASSIYIYFSSYWLNLQRFARPLGMVCCLTLFFCAWQNPNFQQTAINAANGNFLRFDVFMKARKNAIQEASLSTANEWPPFGLWGELQNKNARKPQIKQGMTPVFLDTPILPAFPLFTMEVHPVDPQKWPNLWAAWIYGVGAISANLPDPSSAINAAINSEALEFAIPENLIAKGVTQAWLVEAISRQNLSWLVLRINKDLPEVIKILAPNPENIKRLLPLPLQKYLLTRLLESAETSPNLMAQLSATLLSFIPSQWQQKEYCAFPLGAGSQIPAIVFISVNEKLFYRLRPFLK